MSLDEAKFLLMKEVNNDESDFLSLNTAPSTNTTNKFKAEKEQFILNIYEYWKAKRLKYVRKN
jgi:hypothetical protein